MANARKLDNSIRAASLLVCFVFSRLAHLQPQYDEVSGVCGGGVPGGQTLVAQSIDDSSRCCPDTRIWITNKLCTTTESSAHVCLWPAGGLGVWCGQLGRGRGAVPGMAQHAGATMMRYNCIWRPMQQQPDSQALAKAVHPLQLAPERTSPATARSRLHSCYWSCSAYFAAGLPV